MSVNVANLSQRAPPWPHAPTHRLTESGTYIVTAGTYLKRRFFQSESLLKVLHDSLLTFAAEYQWHLEAWAVFSNHYHFVAHAPEDVGTIENLLRKLHSETAKAANHHDDCEGRRVWYQYWDTELTYERSYLARLNYVHQNPVKHGLVRVANQYPYCSAAWFERVATPAQVKMLYSLKTDKVNVKDDF